uniref:Alkaline phytoceramidase n=1 Tax=Solibacter usitatus (strain Ellin6076) TaxID=234267 RepID=Q01NA9_SOLUE
MRIALFPALAVLAVLVLLFVPPIAQDAGYHNFADQRTLFGIPYFWNVVSNLPFLLVALWGLRGLRSKTAFEETWERVAYGIFLFGIALVAFGSSYYHARPNNDMLVWDRLPMTIGFMSLLSIAIGERISSRAGRMLLFPLIAVGIASVLFWQSSGDLRFYGFVQFYTLLALPLMVALFPPRYTGTGGLVALAAFYVVAKLLESFDHTIGRVIVTGGHPWKHVAAAIGVLCYVISVERRRPR